MTGRTDYVHVPRAIEDPYCPTSVPMYQTATFGQSRADGFDEFDYSRSGNPTRRVLEDQLARIEHGTSAYAFSSGMAAISAVVRLCRAGDEVLVGDESYGGTIRLLREIAPRLGLTARAVDTTCPKRVAASITDRTRLLLLETPSNPTLRITDLAAMSSIARQRGIILAVDNTMLSPWLQNPLDHGADVVVHSATKHLNGHGDVTAGAVCTSRADLAGSIAFIQNAEGAALGPFDSWLLLRGLATLPLRLEAQQRSAGLIADWLADHAAVAEVFYPTLPTHPGLDIQRRQARGGGCVISVRTGSPETARHIVERTRLFRTTVSFGCISSSISLPRCMSHACVDAGSGGLGARPVPPDLVRLSVGIEDPNDLIADLDRALRPVVQAAATRVPSPARTGAGTDG